MIGDLLKKIFGDKSTRDQKIYKPFVDAANGYLTEIQQLSDDALRAKSFEFRKIIAEATKPLEERAQDLRDQAADSSLSIEDKERLFESLDESIKEIDEKIEEVLLNLLPEAFAVVKETAHRWASKIGRAHV